LKGSQKRIILEAAKPEIRNWGRGGGKDPDF